MQYFRALAPVGRLGERSVEQQLRPLGVPRCKLDLRRGETAPETIGSIRLGRERDRLLEQLGRGADRASAARLGGLLFGAMSWSLKMRDLLRDPLCVLHSAITGPDRGEPELKLYGRAVEVDDQIRDGCQEGWWAGRPRDAATVFALTIEQATFISWDLEHGQMTVRRWSPERGYTKARRRYP